METVIYALLDSTSSKDLSEEASMTIWKNVFLNYEPKLFKTDHHVFLAFQKSKIDSLLLDSLSAIDFIEISMDEFNHAMTTFELNNKHMIFKPKKPIINVTQHEIWTYFLTNANFEITPIGNGVFVLIRQNCLTPELSDLLTRDFTEISREEFLNFKSENPTNITN